MRLRTITRASAAGALVCVLAASWLTFGAPSAGALTKEGMVIGPDESIDRTYTPIPANNPASEAIDPATCATSTYCDVLPIEVVRPADFDPDQEYFVRILLEWESRKAPGDPVIEPSGYALNDLDTYIYTDPPTNEEAERRGHTPDSDGPWVASGATGAQPEQAFLFRPAGKYLMVVSNFIGVNTGYKVTLTWVSESFPAPFESLAPEFSRPTTTTTTTRPTSTTTLPESVPVVTTPPPTVPGGLTPAPVLPDEDFGGDFEGGSFDDELAAPPTIPISTAQVAAPPPSGLALVLWLLAVPLALVAAGGGIVVRRNAAMITTV